jgi:hypothetical protein
MKVKKCGVVVPGQLPPIPFIAIDNTHFLSSLKLELRRVNIQPNPQPIKAGAGMVTDRQSKEPSGSALTPHRAVLIGQLVVNLPVVSIMGLAFLLAYVLKGPTWAPIALLLAVIPAWLWWSFMVPRWREWAKRQGVDENETQLIGERSGLVWPEGSIFEKTEFHSRKSATVERQIERGSEEARVLEEARGFVDRWRRRTIVVGLALFVNIASIVPFLAGHSLHGQFFLVGRPLLIVSLCLLVMFVFSAAQTYNFWMYLQDCKMLYRTGTAKSR